MNSETARELLMSYRRGTTDVSDPEIRAALEFACIDTEVRDWLHGHLRTQANLRSRMREIPVPETLGRDILQAESARRRIIRIRHWKQGAAAAAAVLMMLLSVALWFEVQRRGGFANYRDRMVRTALRDYRMQMVSGDVSQIRQYLRDHRGHPDLAIEPKLTQLQPIGCAILRWNDQPVSLVCFDSPKQGTVYLFVSKATKLTGGPLGTEPQFSQVNKMSTASWSRGDETYLLAIRGGDDSFLRDQLTR